MESGCKSYSFVSIGEENTMFEGHLGATYYSF